MTMLCYSIGMKTRKTITIAISSILVATVGISAAILVNTPEKPIERAETTLKQQIEPIPTKSMAVEKVKEEIKPKIEIMETPVQEVAKPEPKEVANKVIAEDEFFEVFFLKSVELSKGTAFQYRNTLYNVLYNKYEKTPKLFTEDKVDSILSSCIDQMNRQYNEQEHTIVHALVYTCDI